MRRAGSWNPVAIEGRFADNQTRLRFEFLHSFARKVCERCHRFTDAPTLRDNRKNMKRRNAGDERPTVRVYFVKRGYLELVAASFHLGCAVFVFSPSALHIIIHPYRRLGKLTSRRQSRETLTSTLSVLSARHRQQQRHNVDTTPIVHSNAIAFISCGITDINRSHSGYNCLSIYAAATTTATVT